MNTTFKGYGNYNQLPVQNIKNYKDDLLVGIDNISSKLRGLIEKNKKVFSIELYPGVNKANLLSAIRGLNIGEVIDVEDAKLDEETLHQMFDDNITEDRVFGVRTYKKLADCFDKNKIESLKSKADNAQEPIFLVGVGAGLVTHGDCYIYVNLPRREAQLRYEAGGSNWLWDTSQRPALWKTKQSYFVEWPLADIYKNSVYCNIDYMIDDSDSENLKMISKENLNLAFNQISKSPFRLKPFFASGIWGGHWMKEVLGLPDNGENYAWCFDGVPEENSIILKYGESTMEIPGLDLILNKPVEVLGDKVYGRFGKEFPIRFNLLDLMGGGNLSLQVHPLTKYVQDTFGVHYTQDESYYILDSTEDSCVYLGVKDGVNKHDFKENLLASERGEVAFDAQRFTNRFPVKQHDHVSIPAGTIHSAGSGTMVLEISATPNIYTFKLWDWGRTDKNGIPRPIHTNHGLANIQWERDTSWIKENILPNKELLSADDNLQVFKTGLHSRESIETHQYIFDEPFSESTNANLSVFNLVGGKACKIKSKDASFEDVTIHYAETFIMPAAVEDFIVEPLDDECTLIRAFIR